MPIRPESRRPGLSFALLGLLLLAATPVPGAELPPLERIMADPDWIGPPVEAAWWQLDGDAVAYRVKRIGTQRRDVHRVTLATGSDVIVEPADQVAVDGPDPVLDETAQRAVYRREGSLFLRELPDGSPRQLTAGSPPVTRAAFASDGTAVLFLRGDGWYRHDLAAGVSRPLTDLRLEPSPLEPNQDSLEPDQLRLFDTLVDELEEERAVQVEAIEAAKVDPARSVPAWYLGEGWLIVDSALAADARWLLLIVERGDPKKSVQAQSGKRDRMPRFVTRSGYVETEDVRRLVGREAPKAQRLWLLDLAARTRQEIRFDGLSGVDVDPLADLKAEQGIDPHDADDPRPVRVMDLAWHPRAPIAALMLGSVDSKDRWIATLDPVAVAAGQATAADGDDYTGDVDGDADAASESGEDVAATTLVERHRLTDPAWINWRFNEFGWIPGTRDLWFLSEETGYAHPYRMDASGAIRQLTTGAFEVWELTVARDGETALIISNRAHPTEHDLYRVDLATGEMTRLTELRGVESYARHPLTGDVLVRFSAPYAPTQLGVLPADGGAFGALTDTRTAAYRAIEWQAPAYVPVPSRHDAGAPIWTKFYPARAAAPGGAGHPVVVFVHGAGYTQNTHHRFPYYFREQMFHNLLTARGYHVIDMDYRASRGYGRDWRTAIYRQMGTPELEDLRDGVAWVVEEHGADPARVGVYGGSYGGFMTLTAMFEAPEVFAAGAALRPVTDWAHYNHPYTANILNTPQVDPEAYRRSSPIEHAEGLAGHLLIAHGMLDDNVFYKDAVRLAQRLIELEKEHWELASYPLEPHGFVHAASWLDEYRRILKLFEATIGAR